LACCESPSPKNKTHHLFDLIGNFLMSVFLNNLDDYLGPAQACTNPLFTSSTPADHFQEEDQSGAAKITLDTSIFDGVGDTIFFQGEEQAKPDLIKTNSEKKATVSLSDCLACSGCVTSAETVLITQQSGEEFLSSIKSKGYAKVVVSVSPQSVASLAAHYELTAAQARRKLATYLRGLGVDHIFDTSCSADFALLEAKAEFIARFQQQQPLPWAPFAASVAESATVTTYPNAADQATAAASEPNPHTVCPMLISACPGWVCYAEKTHPNSLPYVSLLAFCRAHAPN
jgi:hypothetical protein